MSDYDLLGTIDVPTSDPWIGLMDDSASFEMMLSPDEMARELSGHMSVWETPSAGNWCVEVRLKRDGIGRLRRRGLHLASTGRWFGATYESILRGSDHIRSTENSIVVPPGHYALSVEPTRDWRSAPQELIYQGDDYDVGPHYVVTLSTIEPSNQVQETPFKRLI